VVQSRTMPQKKKKKTPAGTLLSNVCPGGRKAKEKNSGSKGGGMLQMSEGNSSKSE